MERDADRIALQRFVEWVEARKHAVSVFFTPWGEALVRKRYREAIKALSHFSNVRKVAIQTNLSCGVGWLNGVCLERVGFWISYHPTQTTQERFLRRCHALHHLGVRFSVGVVGIREHIPLIEALRRELPPSVYLWINAYRGQRSAYSEEELERFKLIDPYFHFNLSPHRSLNKPCYAGQEVVSIDGDGAVRRCHFIEEPLGNIYDTELEELLTPRNCSRGFCGCHIGYVHLKSLSLYETFEGGILERIPFNFRYLFDPPNNSST